MRFFVIWEMRPTYVLRTGDWESPSVLELSEEDMADAASTQAKWDEWQEKLRAAYVKQEKSNP